MAWPGGEEDREHSRKAWARHIQGAVRRQACLKQENMHGVKVRSWARPRRTQGKAGLHPGASRAMEASDKTGALESWA